MTSWSKSPIFVRPSRIAGTLLRRYKHSKMNRDISPPAPKRRKVIYEPPPISRPGPPKALPGLGENTIRVFSWNINGIAPFLQKSITSYFRPLPQKQGSEAATPPASLRDFLRRHKWPSILFLQEVKIATNDTDTQDAIKAAVNRSPWPKAKSGEDEPTYEAHFVLPNDVHNAKGFGGKGKVYGVCSIFRSDLREKHQIMVRTVDWDKEGRISVLEFDSGSAKLAIFNIYAVNGTDNPYRDPATGKPRGTRHDRKLQVHRLLMQECKKLEKNGWDVVLAGDMNVAPDSRDGFPKLRTFPQQHVVNRSDFHARLLEGEQEGNEEMSFNGVDIWRKMHGDERRFTWFSRTKAWGTSCDRVDYFIVSTGAWDKGYIKDCGIMDSKEERGPSDHVPIWADIEIPVTKDIDEG